MFKQPETRATADTLTFKWPTLPTTDADFEKLMWAIDTAFHSEGISVSERPLRIGLKLWEAFKFEGRTMPPDEFADQPGFDGEILIAKANRWYKAIYGKKLLVDFSYGYAPLKLRNALWRVRFSAIAGRVQFVIKTELQGPSSWQSPEGRTYNCLTSIEHLTQGLASRLSHEELTAYLHFFMFGFKGLLWRYECIPPTDLFWAAQHDYATSTESLFSLQYGHARWGAQQAVEKTLKGLLDIRGQKYPKGKEGHNLKIVAKALQEASGIRIAETILNLAQCSTKVRYGHEGSTEEQALLANTAVLELYKQLSESSIANKLLSEYTPPKETA